MTNIHRLRWALLCVAATTGSLLATAARASQTVKIESGDSLDSLARRFHVPVRAIAKANGITPETILRNGRKIIIPDAPKPILKQATMRRPAVVTGNRIAIRIGPDQQHRRVTLVDHGARLVVTHKSGEWLQVKTESGKTGWIKSDFVRLGKGDLPEPTRVAKANKSKRSEKSARLARRDRDDEDRPRRKRSRRASLARQEREERSSRRGRHNREYASSRRSRSRNWAASYRRSRHGSRPEADAPPAEADVVRMAYAYRGTPYHFGASGHGAFDCSGFTSYVYRKQGVSLPHNASEQFSHGSRVKGGEMKPGDLVFFHTTRRGISHVGIYAGKGKFVHASSGGGRVRVDSLNDGYYRSRLVGARRIK